MSSYPNPMLFKYYLNVSKFALIMLSILYFGCVILLVFFVELVFIKLIALLIILIDGYLKFYRYIFLKGQKSTVSFWNESGSFWFLQNSNHEAIKCVLQKNCFLSKYLLVLNFSFLEKKLIFNNLSILVFYDSLPKDKFRKLRVELLTKS